MDGTQEANTESQSPAVAEGAQEQAQNTEQTNGGKPEGWEQVELDGPVKDRFNRVYGQMKRQERVLKDNEAVLKAQADVIEELRRSQSQVVGFLHEKDYQETEKTLRAQKQQARDAGDWNAVDEIDEKIFEIKAKKLTAQTQPKTQQPQATRPAQSEALDVQQAVQKGTITNEEANIYTAWSGESNEYGEIKRSWTNPSDPRYRAALRESSAVFSNPAFENKSFAEKLQEIDRRMGMANQRQAQQVLGSNLTSGGGGGKVMPRLTEQQRKIAIGTRHAGAGKSDDEHVASYTQALIKSKGGRK